MNLKYRGILCVFIITTLFLCAFGSQVLAKTAQELIEGYEICVYESEDRTSDGLQPLYTNQVIILPFTKNDVIYDESSHEIQLAENDFINFEISYMKNGEWVTEEPKIGINENTGKFELWLSQKLEEGTDYYISVIESKETVAENDDERMAEVTETVTSTEKAEFRISRTLTAQQAGRTTLLSAAWDSLRGGLNKLGKILLETICDIIVPEGDAFLDMVCNSIGEVVTIDRIVYNKVSKVDIDFFTDSSDSIEGENMTLSTPLKSIMGTVVDKLYVFFRNIVIVFYLVMLVYIALKIMSTSTAARRADYKSMLVAWVMGVIMLMFFPYVIKYTIKLNSALCQMISDINAEGQEFSPTPIEGLAVTKYHIQYGDEKFVAHILNGRTADSDAMMNVRAIGASESNLPLIIVYFIFIGQLIAILIMYYKRVFMTAFLIAIFPVVVAIYPLNRIGEIRLNPFGEWLREFVINVFVQSFHAATYKVIVTIGASAYASDRNWLFLIISVLFLFEGEKIIRAIFSAGKSANTIGNMAMAGAFAMKIMKNVGAAIPSIDKKKEEEDENAAKDKARKDVIKQTTSTPAADANKKAVRDIAMGTSGEGANEGVTTDINVLTTPSTAATYSATLGTANIDNQIAAAKKNMKASNIGSKIIGTSFNVGSQVAGSIIGTTYGLAQNNAKQPYEAAISSFISGKKTGAEIGQSARKMILDRADKRNTREAAMIVATEYEEGKHDEEAGINEADRQLRNERAQAIRKAYADYIRRSTGLRGKSGAQLDFYKTQMKILNESLDRKED